MGETRGGADARVAGLRELLGQPGLEVIPRCHDALSARLVERAGGHPDRIVDWAHLNEVVGLEDYYRAERRYAAE